MNNKELGKFELLIHNNIVDDNFFEDKNEDNNNGKENEIERD